MPHGDFRALVENAPDIIARYDRDLRHLYINPAVEAFAGRPPEFFIGKTSAEAGILDPEFARVWEDALRAAFDEAEEQVREFRIERPDRVIWTDTRFVPELDDDGKVESVLEITRDITARKEAEADLKRTTDHLGAVLDASPLAVVGLDLEGRVTTWNPAAERIFGWPEDEVVGASLPRVPDASWIRMKEVASRVLRGETVTGFEVEVRARSLRRVLVSVSAAPLHASPSPGITGILAILEDVTERKRIEEERRRLISVLEASPDFVGMSDAEGNVLWINEAGKRMVGMDPDERVKGMAITSFHPPRIAAEVVRSFAAPASTSPKDGESAEVLRVETLLLHRDGTEIPVSLAGVVHRDGEGRILYRSMIARDLRQRKALEAQLRHSQRMEAVGRLAGGVAHEFNNILTAIQGHADLALLADGLSEEIRGDLREIQEGTARAAALTRQLTAFARRQQSLPRRVDLGEVVRRAEPALASVAGDAVNVRVEVAQDQDLDVEVDPGQVEQALVAMTLNARDAMPRGGTLRIRVCRRTIEGEPAGGRRPPADEGPYLAIQVIDTGTGMDAATRERAFEPFFTTKDPSRHSGLGLSGVYGMVKQNRGWVTTRSELGEGSTFTLFFPAAVEAKDEPPRETANGTSGWLAPGIREG